MTVHPTPRHGPRSKLADRLLLLTWKKVLVAAMAWVLAVVLHNAAYALLADSLRPDGDEPFFFVLAVVVIPGWLVVAAVYSLARQRSRR